MNVRNQSGRKGMAAIAMMVLLLFLVSMIAVVLRANAMDRRKTLFLQDQLRARALAERNVLLAARNCAAGSLTGEKNESGEDYTANLTWAPSDSAPDIIRIHSEINMDRGAFEPVHISLSIDLRCSPGRAAAISWSE